MKASAEISPGVFKLCQNSSRTISSEHAKKLDSAPSDIANDLFKHGTASARHGDLESNRAWYSVSDGELQRAQQCGSWGSTTPSRLFLQAFHASLRALDPDPLAGMVSPALAGSQGKIPLTIIAPLADLVRHMANLIVGAETEVFLATCSWCPSVAQRLVNDALLELSNRAGRRNARVVVKVMYDKAGPGNFVNSRVSVSPETYSGKGIQLPSPADIPNLDLEVISFHKPLLGTLHAKFMVVDRKVAVVQSNNMEDNDNMEMLTHLEGPIVNSIYDTALLTWGRATNPKLPRAADHTIPQRVLPSGIGDTRTQEAVIRDGETSNLAELEPGAPHYDATLEQEITRMQHVYSPKTGETRLQAINRQLNLACPKPIGPTAAETDVEHEFVPYIPHAADNFCPIAMVSRMPFGTPTNSSKSVPQDEAWLSCVYNAQDSIFIQTPDLNASPLYEALTDALKRGVKVTYYVCLGYNDAGELMPGQGGTNEMFASKFTAALGEKERGILHICYYVGKDQNVPIHNSFKSRSCHIKLMIVDGHIGIQGSGNQDTQSWFHSQEINIMVDSEEVCSKWREGIERNQNTAKYGKAGKDGVWRDSHGQEAPGSTGEPGTIEGYFKGIVGMVKKAQAKGGLG